MSFLFQGPQQPPTLTGLPIQTAVNALPIPIVYGSPRIAPNIIYVNGFKALKTATGTKGILGGGKGQQDVHYTATVIFGLCEGLISDVMLLYQDNGVYTLGKLPPGEILTLFYGGDGQAPWSYIVSNWPADALSFPFVAYLAAPNLTLDSTATIPQFSMMVKGVFAGTSPLNPIDLTPFDPGLPAKYFADADPMTCAIDLLTNTRYGVGFPSALIDPGWETTTDGFNPGVGDAAAQSYCQAVGMAFSLSLSGAGAASGVLQRWFELLGIAPVWTGASLKFLPYWDQPSGNNPGWDAAALIPKRYYTPATVPLFDLTDDDFLIASENEDPVTLERSDQIDVLNTVRVRFRDRNVEFNDNVAEAKDEATIENHGIRVDELSGAGEFTYQAYAATAAAIRVYRNVSVRNRYTFRLPLIYCFLDPMDIVTITDVAMGLDRVAVRIVSIEEDDKLALTITAEEFPAGGLSPKALPLITTGGTTLNTAIAPPPVYTPVIRKPPAAYLSAFNRTPIIQLGVSGGVTGNLDLNWGGCLIYVSVDGVTYQQQQAIIAGPSRVGNLTANFASHVGANPDTVSTLTIDFSQSAATIASGSDADAAAGRTLLWVGNELLGYTGATLVGPSTYLFTRIWRGLYGTPITGASAGEHCMRVDEAIAEINLPSGYTGSTLHVKLPSFNIWNQSLQQLSDCVDYTFVA